MNVICPVLGLKLITPKCPLLWLIRVHYCSVLKAAHECQAANWQLLLNIVKYGKFITQHTRTHRVRSSKWQEWEGHEHAKLFHIWAWKRNLCAFCAAGREIRPLST